MTAELICKTIGAILGSGGSILIAWRAYNILKWIKSTVDSHEISLTAITQVINREPQTVPMITGMTTHLDNYEKGWGIKLLVTGFIMIILGVIFTVISFWL